MSSIRVSRERLAAEIAALRREKGWTQEEFGDRLGVTGATVSRWESALSIPRAAHLHRLSAMSAGFRRFFGMPEREQLDRAVAGAAGILKEYRIGEHDVVLLEDGRLLINGYVWIAP